MKTLDEQIAVMTAFKNGAVIEWRRHDRTYGDDWFSLSTPNWNWELFDYRIAAQPPVERWALIRGAGCVDNIFFYECDAYKDKAAKGGRVVLLREVLPPDPKLLRVRLKAVRQPFSGLVFLQQQNAADMISSPGRVIQLNEPIDFIEVPK